MAWCRLAMSTRPTRASLMAPTSDRGTEAAPSDNLDDLGMTNESGLAAAILAGGQARRLGGVNKGTLALGDSQIVDRQLAALRTVASTVFVVGRDSPAWSARGLPVVADDVPGAGALGGIYTAI